MPKPVLLSKIALAVCIPALLTSCVSFKPYIAANMPGVKPEATTVCHALLSYSTATLAPDVTVQTLASLYPEYATKKNAAQTNPRLSVSFSVSSETQPASSNPNVRYAYQLQHAPALLSSNEVVITPLNAAAFKAVIDQKGPGFYVLTLTGDQALFVEFDITLPAVTTYKGTYPGPTFHYKQDKQLFFDGCEA